MFLSEVRFKEDFRCYKKGDKVVFEDPLTIISGDNGSGKSTLISSIRCLYNVKWSMSHDSRAENKIEADTENLNGEVYYLDLTQDLYKTSPEIKFDDIDTYMSSLNSSSGEGSFLQMINLLSNSYNSADLIIIDEPERGLSIKKQIAFYGAIKSIMLKNPDLQIILITHSEELMSLSSKLFSTSHKSYISTSEYLSWMRN